MMNTLRAFIALEMPPMVVDIVRQCQQELQRNGVRMKWIRPESVHLTIRFLGNISSEAVADIRGILEELADDSPSFCLQLKGVGVFPSPSRPRVLWIGLDGDMHLLEESYRRLSNLLFQKGIPKENRPFRGHLTIGRTKGPVDAGRLKTVVGSLENIESRPFSADRIGLYKSDLRPGGAVYTPLFQIRTGR